jgi:hypothetical protein
MGVLLDIARKSRDSTTISDPRQSANSPPSTIAPDELVELRTLVNAVAAFHGFTPGQTAEAQQIAQADAVAALECFRSLAERDGLTIH